MRIVAVVAASLAAACLAAPAAEATRRKPLHGSYALTLPVPYPLEAESGSHCQDAPEVLSKDARKLPLPAATGKLKVSLSGHVGDWVVELWDAKGRMLTLAGGVGTGDTVTTATYKKKSRTSEALTVMVCNYSGGPTGQVAWSFMFD